MRDGDALASESNHCCESSQSPTLLSTQPEETGSVWDHIPRLESSKCRIPKITGDDTDRSIRVLKGINFFGVMNALNVRDDLVKISSRD